MHGQREFKIKFTKPQEEEMVRLYNTGSTLREISDIYGIDPSTVRYRLMRMGVVMRARKRRCPYTKAQLDQIVAMSKHGYRWYEIAQELDSDGTTVKRWYQKHIANTSS